MGVAPGDLKKQNLARKSWYDSSLKPRWTARLGSTSISQLAKSAVESLAIVSMGEDSPVELVDGSGDMGGASSVSCGRGTLCFRGDGEGEEDEGGVINPASPFLKACKSPVDRFIVNARSGGAAGLSASSTDSD